MPVAVSIIVPAFNAEAYVSHALASALSQTWLGFEVVVVDDGSTDRTVDEVQRIAAGDRRVRLLRHQTTQGVAAARNTAIAAARGEWIAPLDADDAYAPDRLRYLLTAARANGADLIADNLMLCSFPARAPLEPVVRRGSALFASPLTVRSFVGGDSAGRDIDLGFLKPMIRREFLERNALCYRTDLRVLEDFCLYVNCLLRGARFLLIPEPFYLYSIRSGSLSNCGSPTAMAEIDRLNRELLESPSVMASPEWRQVFQSRQRGIDRMILYTKLVEAIRERQFMRAFNILRCHPREFWFFVRRLSQAAQRRLSSTPYRPRGRRA